MGTLSGKVAVITGSTRGLGLAVAQLYAREGAAVVVSSRTPTAVEQAVAALKASGGIASGQTTDVADLEQVRALGQHAIDTFGRFDIWVNNAALSAPYGPTMSIPPERFVQVTNANVLGAYYGSHVALRHFLLRRAGKLINVVGRGARGPVAFQNAYAASKAWLRNFTLALAEEHKDDHVGIFVFSPGMVITDLLQDVEVVPGYQDKVRRLPTVVRLWGHPPEEPAEKALWLASAATDGKTGLEVNVLGRRQLVGGVLGEAKRRLKRAAGPDFDMQVRVMEDH